MDKENSNNIIDLRMGYKKKNSKTTKNIPNLSTSKLLQRRKGYQAWGKSLSALNICNDQKLHIKNPLKLVQHMKNLSKRSKASSKSVKT
mmetsp:Transcript_20856/g.18475  ORF Transcript_20856/g.18475 Transcript_20856/m.18475 type:complete len:89 (+) Transcript_20856:44-310(+)